MVGEHALDPFGRGDDAASNLPWLTATGKELLNAVDELDATQAAVEDGSLEFAHASAQLRHHTPHTCCEPPTVVRGEAPQHTPMRTPPAEALLPANSTAAPHINCGVAMAHGGAAPQRQPLQLPPATTPFEQERLPLRRQTPAPQ